MHASIIAKVQLTKRRKLLVQTDDIDVNVLLGLPIHRESVFISSSHTETQIENRAIRQTALHLTNSLLKHSFSLVDNVYSARVAVQDPGVGHHQCASTQLRHKLVDVTKLHVHRQSHCSRAKYTRYTYTDNMTRISA